MALCLAWGGWFSTVPGLKCQSLQGKGDLGVRYPRVKVEDFDIRCEGKHIIIIRSPSPVLPTISDIVSCGYCQYLQYETRPMLPVYSVKNEGYMCKFGPHVCAFRLIYKPILTLDGLESPGRPGGYRRHGRLPFQHARILLQLQGTF